MVNSNKGCGLQLFDNGLSWGERESDRSRECAAIEQGAITSIIRRCDSRVIGESYSCLRSMSHSRVDRTCYRFVVARHHNMETRP